MSPGPLPIHGLLASPDAPSLRKLLDPARDCNVLINLTAALKPKTVFDHFMNAVAPEIIAKFLQEQENSAWLLHVSTINVLFEDIRDPYSLGKREGEARLRSHTVKIIRPGLVWSWNGEGNAASLDRYFKLPLPVHSMLKPGNLYQPISPRNFSRFLCEEMEKGISGRNSLLSSVIEN